MKKTYFEFDENLTKFVEYKVLGKLPDPFLFENGEKVNSIEDWNKRRKEIYKYAVELQYGQEPPKPEIFDFEYLYKATNTITARITAGSKEKQLSFILRITIPQGIEKPPIVVDGDMVFPAIYTSEYMDEFLGKGIAYASFNRVEVANDIQGEGYGVGPLYKIYPNYSFGALMAWAWGYMRVVDALEKMDLFDLSALAFTGHSRGAKAAMLAGVLDERAKIVNPNDSNGGSCGCYRIHAKGIREDGTEQENETLDFMMEYIDFWLGKDMAKYRKCEEKLPFDCHFLKALVAPRILLVGEGASDMWTNPIGSWQTSMAAKEVFKFLGCEDNLKWYFRRGYHAHRPEDAGVLANLILNKLGKEELLDVYYKTPFKKPKFIWDWKRPNCQ